MRILTVSETTYKSGQSRKKNDLRGRSLTSVLFHEATGNITSSSSTPFGWDNSPPQAGRSQHFSRHFDGFCERFAGPSKDYPFHFVRKETLTKLSVSYQVSVVNVLQQTLRESQRYNAI